MSLIRLSFDSDATDTSVVLAEAKRHWDRVITFEVSDSADAGHFTAVAIDECDAHALISWTESRARGIRGVSIALMSGHPAWFEQEGSGFRIDPDRLWRDGWQYRRCADREIAGTYVAVSESEWEQRLVLEVDGRATLTNASWLAGEHASREVDRYDGTWTYADGVVELRIDLPDGSSTVVERLTFDPRLPLADLGRSGTLPGLAIERTTEASPLWPGSMWREDGLKER